MAGNDAKLNVFFQGMTLNYDHACTFERVDEDVSGGKLPAGKGMVGLLS